MEAPRGGAAILSPAAALAHASSGPAPLFLSARRRTFAPCGVFGVLVAFEALVGLDVDECEEAAGGPVADFALAVARTRAALAVVDARGEAHPLVTRPPRRSTRRTAPGREPPARASPGGRRRPPAAGRGPA